MTSTPTSNIVNVNNATSSAVTLTTSNDTEIYLNGASQPSYTFAAPSATYGNGCTSATVGSFINPDNTTNLATALAAAINDCNTTYAAGYTATSSTGTVTVTDATPGTGGNSVGLASGLTGFGWTAGATKLAGGTDGTTSTTSSSSETFAYWSGSTYVSQAQVATNIATAVNANTTVSGVITTTANSPATNDVTFVAKTAGTGGNRYSVAAGSFGAVTGAGSLIGGTTTAVQPNAFPAKYGASLTAASCANDFVVYPTGQAGAPGAANIIAYNEIYVGAGCTTPNPTVYWAYNTAGSGAPDSVTTSPIMAPYGDQVAYIQSNGTFASLVLLRWKKNSNDTMTAPETLTSVGTGSYFGCTAPCMVSMELNGAADDTYSAPYYDWTTDTLYVGDDSGKLHKFTPVFYGTPAEVVSGWPESLSGNKVSSPVFDTGSGNVLVGDMGGILYSVPAAGGTVHSTGTTDLLDTSGIADAPLVNGTGGSLLVFVNQSGAYSETGYNAIYEFSTGFTSFFFAQYARGHSTRAVGRGEWPRWALPLRGRFRQCVLRYGKREHLCSGEHRTDERCGPVPGPL